jgi:transposase
LAPGSWFLYDLTNTYFEGQCLNNEWAARGCSKEKRSDCPLVTLALVVDYRGFPVLSRIYDGNQSESATLFNWIEKHREICFLVNSCLGFAKNIKCFL